MALMENIVNNLTKITLQLYFLERCIHKPAFASYNDPSFFTRMMMNPGIFTTN